MGSLMVSAFWMLDRDAEMPIFSVLTAVFEFEVVCVDSLFLVGW